MRRTMTRLGAAAVIGAASVTAAAAPSMAAQPAQHAPSVTVVAADDKVADDNSGMWGLAGLLGALGLAGLLTRFRLKWVLLAGLLLGVLRLGSKVSARGLADRIKAGISAELVAAAKGANLYLVGGSFRAFAQLDLRLTGHPLPIVHQHCLTPDRIRELRALVRVLCERIGRIAQRHQVLGVLADPIQRMRV